MFNLTMDSKPMVFVGRLVDLLLLNLLWLAFCLPVVTIGASTAAAHYVCLKMVDDEEGRIARSFVKAFKDNFKRGSLLWLMNAAAFYALYIDWQLVTKADSPSLPLIIASLLSAAFVFCAFIYSYPLIARYENSLMNSLRNSFRICFRYFGRTLVLVLVLLLEIGLFSWNSTMLVLGALFGPMILIYTVSGISKRIFQDIDRKNAVEG
jgi:uncharacterized membrane protein YesL